MARYKLNAESHSCKLWSLKKGQITPEVTGLVEQSLLEHTKGTWTKVYGCNGGCGILVEKEKDYCPICSKLVGVDFTQSIRKLLPKLQDIKEKLSQEEWDKFKETYIQIEQDGDNRATILRFLDEN